MFKIYVFSIGGFSSLIWYHLYYSYCNSKWVIFFRSFVEAAWKWPSRIEGHEWIALQGWCLHCWNITWGRSQTAWIYKTPKTMVQKTRIISRWRIQKRKLTSDHSGLKYNFTQTSPHPNLSQTLPEPLIRLTRTPSEIYPNLSRFPLPKSFEKLTKNIPKPKSHLDRIQIDPDQRKLKLNILGKGFPWFGSSLQSFGHLPLWIWLQCFTCTYCWWSRRWRNSTQGFFERCYPKCHLGRNFRKSKIFKS